MPYVTSSASNKVLSMNEIAALCIAVGLSGEAAATAVAITQPESGGKPDAVGDVNIQSSTWGPSVGLWQIRSINAQRGKGTSRDELANKDPMHNAKAMMEISSNGTKWSAWSTFSNGAYRPYLADARKAVANPGAAPSGGSGGAASAIGGGLDITNGGTWSRAGLFVLGGGLLAIVAWRSMNIGGAVAKAAKVVAHV